jgi:hypothetical protein
MNPFADQKLTSLTFAPPERIDGACAEQIARTIGTILGDPFAEYANPKNARVGARLTSYRPIREILDDGGRAFLVSKSRDVTLGLGCHVVPVTVGRLAVSEVDFACAYSEPLLGLAESWFAAVAELVQPYWGVVETAPARRALNGQFLRPDAPGVRPLPPGIPRIRAIRELASKAHPLVLAWINYWSPATCDLLRFPDPTRDADLLSRSRQLATGGWLVRLTDDPLDPARPEHLRALVEGYARFPAIGQR